MNQIVTKFLLDGDKFMPKNPKYGGYQRGLAFMIYKCFDKKLASGGVNTHVIKWN